MRFLWALPARFPLTHRLYNFLLQRHRIVRFRNRGNLEFDPPVDIATYSSHPGPIVLLNVDLNGDSTEDLLAMQPFTGIITWFPSTGSALAGQFTITLNDAGVMHSAVCDLDEDGLVDIVVAAYRDDAVGWHQQVSPGQFAPRVDIGHLSGPSSVSCADVNHDGINDVLATGLDSDSVIL
jgi:hypothetical protein